LNTIIISDTSCLIALYDIGEMELLTKIFDEVWVTPEVEREFDPELPNWISVKTVQDKARQAEFEKAVDPGEASAIALALETPGCQLLLDDRQGRKLAAAHQLPFIGTLGLLLEAKKRGAIAEVRPYLEKLEVAEFWISEAVKKEVLKKANEDFT
jgi:predicted nucleic acid-binding protein